MARCFRVYQHERNENASFLSILTGGGRPKWRFSNFPRFWKNSSALGSFNCIFENNSLKALFGQNMKKLKILKLSPDSRYLQKLALNFSRIVIKALFAKIVKHFTVGYKQRPRNWQKTHTGQSLKTLILCSHWLPTVTRVKLQTVHLFFLNRHYFPFLLDEWWYPVSSSVFSLQSLVGLIR